MLLIPKELVPISTNMNEMVSRQVRDDNWKFVSSHCEPRKPATETLWAPNKHEALLDPWTLAASKRKMTIPEKSQWLPHKRSGVYEHIMSFTLVKFRRWGYQISDGNLLQNPWILKIMLWLESRSRYSQSRDITYKTHTQPGNEIQKQVQRLDSMTLTKANPRVRQEDSCTRVLLGF